jgi:hypothetical protein
MDLFLHLAVLQCYEQKHLLTHRQIPAQIRALNEPLLELS